MLPNLLNAYMQFFIFHGMFNKIAGTVILAASVFIWVMGYKTRIIQENTKRLVDERVRRFGY